MIAKDILVVHWEWTVEPYAPATFWAAHSVSNDGRFDNWPKIGLRAIGAARVTVADGQGLELLPIEALSAADAASLTGGRRP